MKHVGFQGGTSLFELGSVADMLCFFSIMRNLDGGCSKYDLLINKFFKKYLCVDELEKATILMEEIRDLFSKLPAGKNNLKDHGWSEMDSSLDPEKANMRDVFLRYFNAFDHCVEISKMLYIDCNFYKPVMIVVTDIPAYYLEERSLEVYDALGPEDAPFWLR